MLMKSLEGLERKQPVNARVADIKKFIHKIKAEKYKEKMFFYGMADKKIAERRANLSKSEAAITGRRHQSASGTSTKNHPSSPVSKTSTDRKHPTEEEDTVIIQVNTSTYDPDSMKKKQNLFKSPPVPPMRSGFMLNEVSEYS